MNLATELYRFTEFYTGLAMGNEDNSLANSNLVLDFMKDMNIRDIQFADLFENYSRLLTRLASLNCFECPKFQEHVSRRRNHRKLVFIKSNKIRFLIFIKMIV